MPGLTGAGSESSKVQDAEVSQERPDINSDIGDVPLTNPARGKSNKHVLHDTRPQGVRCIFFQLL